MAAQRWILFLLAAAMITLLAGCQGGSTANVQNPPPPAQSNVAISFQPQPNPSIAISFSENVTATVTNDPNNYGVDWTLTCQLDPKNANGLCGSVNPPHTDSGSPTTYTAPSSISTNSTVVEIVAFATANPNMNVVAPVTITTFNNGLAGTYVLQAQGVDGGLEPYQFSAVISLDGKGNIINADGNPNDLAGEQTVDFFDPILGAFVSKSDPIVSQGSSYFIGYDGRGTITLQTNDTDIGGNGLETFAFVYLSSSQALISQMDLGANAATGFTASGTMDLQPSAPIAPTGGYAFAASGVNITNINKQQALAVGGVFNVDSANTISGNGSVADEILVKAVNPGTAGVSSTLSGTLTPAFGATTVPDQFGAFLLNLTTQFGSSGKATALQFTGYIIDSTHIKLIESDAVFTGGKPFAITAGQAIGQGAATGTFADSTSLSGPYVFGVLGTDLSVNPNTFTTNSTPATFTSVGVLTATGAQGSQSGALSNGFTDTFLELNTAQGTLQNPQAGSQISAAYDGTYAVDATGTGRAVLMLTNFSPNPKNGYSPEVFFYLTGLTGGGNPAALVLQAANTNTGEKHYPSLGAGAAYTQSAAIPVFNGDFGASFTQELSLGGQENDGTATVIGNSSATPPLTGAADINLFGGANQDQLFAGTFSAMACADGNGSDHCLPGTLLGDINSLSVVFTPQIAVDYYSIDLDHGFFVETDLVTPGALQNGQVSFGYYAPRTPVCSGCQ